MDTDSDPQIRIVVGGETLTRRSVGSLVEQLQSPPFDQPVVVDLSAVRHLDHHALVTLCDTLRWRLVWSTVVVTECGGHAVTHDLVRLSPTVTVAATAAGAMGIARLDARPHGPGRRGWAPFGTFAVGRPIKAAS